MGKTANNERIKLQATFYNNCAVALAIAGAFLPVLAFYGRLPQLAEIVKSTQPDGSWWKHSEFHSVAFSFLATLVAMIIASILRWRADKTIQSVED